MSVMMSSRTHYLNAEFDLALRPRSRWRDRPRIVRQVRELSAQALLGADAGDAALLRVDVPEEFLDYLAACGAPVPRVLTQSQLAPGSRLRPFGWTAEAIELNRMHDSHVEHPTPETLERVNARSFALELASTLDDASPAGGLLHDIGELTDFLDRAPPNSEWVIKGEHGNSGLANRRLRAPGLGDADRRFAEGLFAEDDCVLIEPWRKRERDWCVVFDAPFQHSTLRVHETTCTRDGAHIGALFTSGSFEEQPWHAELAAMAETVAARLTDAAYFGPVCVDAFEWRDGDRLRLRSFVDLNCRRSMSDGAYRFWRHSAPDRVVYYRFFTRRKLGGLSADLPRALCELGDLRYERDRRVGVLLASPLRFHSQEDGGLPVKLALAFVADSRSRSLELERRFRTRFEV